MSFDTDPPRLSEEAGGASEAVRTLVNQCRDDVATSRELEALEGRLTPLLWNSPSPVSAPSGGATGGGAIATWLKLGAVAAVTAGTAGAFWVGTEKDTAPKHAAPKMTAPTLAPRAVQPRAPAVATENARPPAPTVAPSVHRPATPAEASASEADLLGTAQAALAGDPGKALNLSEQHARTFPRGVLVQEREVIAIEALTRLGRSADALARAERFLKAYPSSAHRSKIESITGSR